MSYTRNIRLMYLISLTSGLSFAASLVVPFFTENGLSQTQIMLLQTIFSVAIVLLDVPTGYVADRYGRAASLIAGSVAIGVGFMGYAAVHGFWQFAAAEIFLGLGFALLSGANEALVYDSLLADGRESYFRKYQANTQSLQFAAVVIAAPIGSLIASKYGIRPVIFIDGSVALLGTTACLLLREPPVQTSSEVDAAAAATHSPWASMRVVLRYCLHGHEQIPWLLLLSATLNGATYFGFWLAPVYYGSVGIPLAWFGVILAVRSGLKVVMSQSHGWVNRHVSDGRQLVAYSAMSVVAYLALAAVHQPVGILFLGLFDIVQALQGPLLSAKLHAVTPSHIRAQVMSVASLCRRGVYAVLGPLLGFSIDRSVGVGFLLAAMIFTALLWLSLVKLRQKGVFMAPV